MADEIDPDQLPQATVVRKKRMRISIVWIIPILAAVVAIGIAIQRVLSEGPTITIAFKAGEGIEAGKTFIRYKDVRIGQVTAVELSEDYSKVRGQGEDRQARRRSDGRGREVLGRRATHLALRRIGAQHAAFGQLHRIPGRHSRPSTSAPSSGSTSRPSITDQPGRRFVLKANTLGSLGVGTPVYYRRLSVGQVAAYNLAADGKSVEITVFVNAPYDKYVTTETRFWNASGINVSVGADGLEVRTESVAALIAGGVAFDTPDFLSPAGPAAGERRVHPVSRPNHRDEAAGPRRTTLRALFQRVGPRPVGRGAGDVVRPAGGRGHRASA